MTLPERVPLLPVPTQTLTTILGGQNCRLFITQRLQRVFCSLAVDEIYIWHSVICHDRDPIRNFKVQDFVGNLLFVDLNGFDEPHYTGFDTRFRLYYITDDVVLDSTFRRRGTDD